MIIPETVEDIILRLIRLASTRLPGDVGWALEAAAGWERNKVAYSQLGAIMDNSKKADFLGRPICQDTGVPIFYVSGKFDSSISKDIENAVKRATKEIPLRPNIVDPITRENTKDNTGLGSPFIHYLPSDKDYTQIDFLPKGAGSENMTKLAMLNPADGKEGIMKFVFDSVITAAGRPCPPTVVGVGIGGTSDRCVEMAKEALLRPLDSANEDSTLKAMEEEMFIALNESGLGPMGLGGDSTVLGVRMKKAGCHTASLPVAVNIGCWACRRASVRIYKDKPPEFSQGSFL